MLHERSHPHKPSSCIDKPARYGVFVDLSATTLDAAQTVAHIELLQVQCGFGAAAANFIVALPPGVEPAGALAGHGAYHQGAATWARALSHGARGRQHLLVIIGTTLVPNEVVPPLVEAFDLDPMLGCATPRFADARTDLVFPLTGADPSERDAGISRTVLPRLPATVLTAEALAPCFVLRRDVVWGLETSASSTSAGGSIAISLSQMRRRGFRNVVVNRAVVPLTCPPDDPYPKMAEPDAAQLAALYPEVARARSENAQLWQHRLEPVLDAAFPARGTPRRLLLDCRGLGAIHNGTSKCILGLLDGFAALPTDWRIDVASGTEAANFHALDERYPAFNLLKDRLSGFYTAIFTPNQPWAVQSIAELHRHGFLLGFNILDTIAWDIVYAAPDRLDRAWRFVARYADVLTYISNYTGDRFRARFPVAPEVTQAVVHLSLARDENTRAELRDLPERSDILLFGNDYDHKAIEPTLRLLVDAFPFQKFVVLGGKDVGLHNVQAIPSGALADAEVHRLVGSARAIVFPSYYEGFGLPVVEGLAYGRPVLVRRNPLWTEIAEHCRLPGQLIEFDDQISLVEALGSLLAGLAPTALANGAALPASRNPANWRDAAEAVLRSFEQRLADSGFTHWRDRDEALELVR